MFKLLTMALRRRRKKKHKQQRASVPVVRRRYMSDGKSFITDVIGHTKPGEEKLQFPYEIPVINTSVAIDPQATKALYVVAGTLAVGMLGSAYLKYKSK